MYAKLDQNFKCPKSLKVMLGNQPRSLRLGMYDALQTLAAYKKKSLKSKTVDKTVE